MLSMSLSGLPPNSAQQLPLLVPSELLAFVAPSSGFLMSFCLSHRLVPCLNRTIRLHLLRLRNPDFQPCAAKFIFGTEDFAFYHQLQIAVMFHQRSEITAILFQPPADQSTLASHRWSDDPEIASSC